MKIELEIYSVKEKVPEYDHDCLIWFGKNNGVYVGKLKNNEWIFEGVGQVTHWAMFPILDFK